MSNLPGPGASALACSRPTATRLGPGRSRAVPAESSCVVASASSVPGPGKSNVNVAPSGPVTTLANANALGGENSSGLNGVFAGGGPGAGDGGVGVGAAGVTAAAAMTCVRAGEVLPALFVSPL